MKLKYEKPIVVLERYALSQGIASCDMVAGPSGNYYCFPNGNVSDKAVDWWLQGTFVSKELGCNNVINQGQDYDGICYHTSINTVFIS